MKKAKKKRTNSQIGATNRRNGGLFETFVREDLESKGLIATKFQGNVGFKLQFQPHKDMANHHKKDLLIAYLNMNPRFLQVVPAKASKFRLATTGFPDFITFFPRDYINASFLPPEPLPQNQINRSDIIGVEAKVKGYLDQMEKAKCRWLLANHIFSRILIAKKIKVGRKNAVEYIDFEVYDKKGE